MAAKKTHPHRSGDLCAGCSLCRHCFVSLPDNPLSFAVLLILTPNQETMLNEPPAPVFYLHPVFQFNANPGRHSLFCDQIVLNGLGTHRLPKQMNSWKSSKQLEIVSIW